MNIHKLTPGQWITRTEPVMVSHKSHFDDNLGIHRERDPTLQFDFIGQKCWFAGVANGVININIGGMTYILPIHPEYPALWEEGWSEYVEVLDVEKVPEKPKRDSSLLVISLCGLISVIFSIVGHTMDDDKASAGGMALSTLLIIQLIIKYFTPADKPTY
jgi:hypothetical protein